MQALIPQQEACNGAIAKFINYPDAFKVREEIDLVVGGTRLVNESVVKINFVY